MRSIEDHWRGTSVVRARARTRMEYRQWPSQSLRQLGREASVRPRLSPVSSGEHVHKFLMNHPRQESSSAKMEHCIFPLGTWEVVTLRGVGGPMKSGRSQGNDFCNQYLYVELDVLWSEFVIKSTSFGLDLNPESHTASVETINPDIKSRRTNAENRICRFQFENSAKSINANRWRRSSRDLSSNISG
jgi:hypothetical protein